VPILLIGRTSSEQLSREQAIEAAAKVLTSSVASKGLSSRRETRVKEILGTLIDKLEEGGEATTTELVHGVDPETSAKITNAEQTPMPREQVIISRPGPEELEHVAERVLTARSAAAVPGEMTPEAAKRLAGRVVDTLFSDPSRTVTQLETSAQLGPLSDEVKTEDVSDDVLNDILGHVVTDLYAGSEPVGGITEDVRRVLEDVLVPPHPAVPKVNVAEAWLPPPRELAQAVGQLSTVGPQQSLVPQLSHRSSSSSLHEGVSVAGTIQPTEVCGDIAADMLDSMFLDPMLTLLGEPVDPALVLLGD